MYDKLIMHDTEHIKDGFIMEKEQKDVVSAASEDREDVNQKLSEQIAGDADEMKKTVLDDNASIYSTTKEKDPVKQTWRELDRKGKWQFFKDYYLLKIAVAVALCSFLIYIGVVTLGPHTEKVLYVAVLLDQLDDTATDKMEDELSDIIKTDKHNIISIDDSFNFTNANSSFSGSDKLTTILYSEIIDVIVTDTDYFNQYSYYGYLKNLDTYLPEDIKEALSDKLLTANVYIESEDTSSENQSAFDQAMGYLDEEDPYGDGVPYVLGIDLSDCEKYKELNPMVENPVLTVAYNAPHKENIYAYIRYLFDLPQA